MAELSLQLRVVRPWWWRPAMLLAAVPIFIRYGLTDGPPEHVVEGFARRWTRRLRIEVV